MKETVSGSLERALPPKRSILLVSKQRIIILPGLQQHARQSNATQWGPWIYGG